MQRSEELFAKALQLIPGGVNSPVRAFRSVGGTPFFTRSASGCRLTTVDGRELIDFVCTWGPAIHGHNPPDVRAAIAAALAERVAGLVPSVEQVRMCNSGTEATMSAVRLARGATGRSAIVKFAGCYHGHVDSLLVRAGSGALTHGHPDSAGIPPAVAAETRVLEFNDTAAVEALFAAEGGRLAAVIVEPYPANCGLILPQPGFLETLRRLCTAHGTVLIFDEVMTGFRLAGGGVQELTGVIPDLTAMGKIIGGGLPVGAFGGRRDLMQHLAPVGPVYQAGTLSGNPLAMAAGIAALDRLQQEQPYARLDAMGARLRDALLAAAREKGLPLQVPQTGSMFALFFADSTVGNYTQALASASRHFKALFHGALERGIYLPPSPFETCFLSTAHSDGDLDAAIEGLTSALKAL